MGASVSARRFMNDSAPSTVDIDATAVNNRVLEKTSTKPIEKSKPERCIISVPEARQANLVTCIPNTPRGNEVNAYPYYCPLCMEYFKDVLRTNCCGNYVCFPCCSTFIQSKGIEAYSISDILSYHNEVSAACSCPHCGTDHFTPALVELADVNIRDYSSGSRPVNTSTTCENISGPRGVSPVKIGDSYENLKRKMIPLKPCAPSSNSDNSSRGDETATTNKANNITNDNIVAIAANDGDDMVGEMQQQQWSNIPTSAERGRSLSTLSPAGVMDVLRSASNSAGSIDESNQNHVTLTNFCENNNAIPTPAMIIESSRANHSRPTPVTVTVAERCCHRSNDDEEQSTVRYLFGKDDDENEDIQHCSDHELALHRSNSSIEREHKCISIAATNCVSLVLDNVLYRQYQPNRCSTKGETTVYDMATTVNEAAEQCVSSVLRNALQNQYQQQEQHQEQHHRRYGVPNHQHYDGGMINSSRSSQELAFQ